MSVVIYTDGGARNNPGPAGIGVVIYDGDERALTLKRYVGERTNNWAEYEALRVALGEARRLGLSSHSIEVRMDSELIVKQMRGEYRVKDAVLKEKHGAVRALLADFADVRFVHVLRAKNKEADALVNEAIDEAV